MDGVELLKRAKAVDQEVEVIINTGYGTVEVAVEAIKEGAYDFITKPVKKASLLWSQMLKSRTKVPFSRNTLHS